MARLVAVAAFLGADFLAGVLLFLAAAFFAVFIKRIV
jgi:hypothetical protein